jgi:hypothetical protein
MSQDLTPDAECPVSPCPYDWKCLTQEPAECQQLIAFADARGFDAATINTWDGPRLDKEIGTMIA